MCPGGMFCDETARLESNVFSLIPRLLGSEVFTLKQRRWQSLQSMENCIQAWRIIFEPLTNTLVSFQITFSISPVQKQLLSP